MTGGKLNISEAVEERRSLNLLAVTDDHLILPQERADFSYHMLSSTEIQ